MKICE